MCILNSFSAQSVYCIMKILIIHNGVINCMTAKELDMDYSKYDFKDSTQLYVYLSKKGLSRGTVEEISKMKGKLGTPIHANPAP